MNTSDKCPACGVKDWKTIDDAWDIEEPYSKPYEVVTKTIICNKCGTGFEADGNGEIIKKADAEARRIAMAQIITDLNEMGNSSKDMEQILRLPERTLSRWKNDQNSNPSAGAYVLMQIIRTYPWILEVVDYKFARNYAEGILLGEAINVALSEDGFYRRMGEKANEG